MSLEEITQRVDKPLRAYLKRFNREAIQVPTADEMKRYLLEKGLLSGSNFKKAVGIEKTLSMDVVLLQAHVYI